MKDVIGHRAFVGSEPVRDGGRDDRLDLLRGIALICIFFDHIPYNVLSTLTVGRLGFSDAAEIFVFLAGYACFTAYGAVLDRRGFRAVLGKLAKRCLSIYGTHIALVLISLLVIMLRTAWTGLQPTHLAPIINDGLYGVWRALSLQALPAYLDILPLYLVLLGSLPLVLLAARSSLGLTLAGSVALYVYANLYHVNVPNQIDRLSAATWTFNPFTWQLVFVLGAAFAAARRDGHRLLVERPRWLQGLCWLYLLFAWLVVGGGNLVPALRDAVPAAFLGNEPRCFLTPWRIVDVAALAYLAVTSRRLTEIARQPSMAPVLASGRQSLSVFAAGCVLALIGRIVFADIGKGLMVQMVVNAVGLGLMLSVGTALDGRRAARGRAAPDVDVSATTATAQAGA